MRTNQELENVLKLNYVTILRLFLSSVSAWPGDELGQKMHWLAKCYRVYLPFQCLAIGVGVIHYIATKDLDLLAMGESVLNMLFTSTLLIREILPLLNGYKDLVRNFLMDFHLIHFKHKGIQFNKVHKTVDEVCHYFTVYMATIALFGSIFFSVPSLYANYKNGAFSQNGKDNITNFHSAISYSYPFFHPLEHYVAITVFNVYCSLVCAVFISIIDLLVILMAFHVIGHIVILRKNLESIPRPEKSENLMLNREKFILSVKIEVFSEEENRNISLILKDCVDHHRVIVRFTDKMSDFLGFMLAFNYTFHLIGCCILLLQSTQGGLNALVRFGPLSLMIFGQLIQISVIFEVIGTVSEKLPDALYCIPWECLDMRNQRSVAILLQRLQRPIHVTAVGMTTVGVTTMAKILKTTISYFAFLTSLNE